MGSERGTATVEWTGLVLVVALALGGLVTAVPAVDGRSFGGFLAHEIVCAARGDCDDGDDALAATYGEADAALLREYAPDLVYEPGERSIPVDWRECRAADCAAAPDDPDLDTHRSDAGRRATAFTRLVRSDGETFLQYWLYYPDSLSTIAGSDRAWGVAREAGRWGLGVDVGAYPGYHRDDWESVNVRIDSAGRAWARASSHHGYQYCKQKRCENRWGPHTGWSRVSRGSHAGHLPIESRRAQRGTDPDRNFVRPDYLWRPLLPGRDLRERTTTAAGLRLVPTETMDLSAYRRLDDGIAPPWEKEVFDRPRSNSTS